MLDLLPHSEVHARAEGTKLREVKKQAVARLFAQTSFATKLSARLIEEYRQRYANLPNGESAQLQQIIERLDQSTNPRQPIAKPTP